MRSLLTFLLVFAVALFVGALLAYPLYLFISLFTVADFNDTIIKSTQLWGFIFSLLYLKYSDQLSLENIGLKIGPDQYLSQFTYGLLSGLFILAVLAAVLTGLGIYALHSSREIAVMVVLKLLLGAMLTGFAVALFEETMFRGALLQGLRKQAGMNIAVLTISLIYAAVHFIHYPQLADGETINWLTAPLSFLTAYSGLINPETMDAFLSLFMLGLLLAFVRVRTRHIIQCIGLHAGLVAGVKLFRFFTEYQPDNSYHYLVSSYDYRLGWLALIWLLIITVGYFVYLHRKAAIKESENLK